MAASRAVLALFASAFVLVVFLNYPRIKVVMNSQNGGYSPWSDWNSCSATCGGGRRVRIRNCSNPVPVGWGKKCSLTGPAYEIESCGENHCPIDGGPGNWKNWGTCDHNCGTGTVTRTRDCDNPKPEFGGRPCSAASLTEKKPCPNLPPCKVDGKYGNYGEFSACSVTCGKGTKKRTRECNNPAPQNGGKNCEGPKEETQECIAKECPAVEAKNATVATIVKKN